MRTGLRVPGAPSLGMRRPGVSILGASGTYIQFVPAALLTSALVGDVVGTAAIGGAYTGTPVWSLTNDAGGKYAINSSTGVVTVAAALSAGTDAISISVSGITPASAAQPFNIAVNSANTITDDDYAAWMAAA